MARRTKFFLTLGFVMLLVLSGASSAAVAQLAGRSVIAKAKHTLCTRVVIAPCAIRDDISTTVAVYFASDGKMFFFFDKDEGVVLQPGEVRGAHRGAQWRNEISVSSWPPNLHFSAAAISNSNGYKVTHTFEVAIRGNACALTFYRTTTSGNLQTIRDVKIVGCEVIQGRPG
jgi:hypothetical protein